LTHVKKFYKKSRERRE